MSLQHVANHLASQGRNGDSMLMHVTPNEVAGLQSLAQQHGGSLTVNPNTGLPEANFLDDIGLGAVNKFVPAIAGAGLSFFTGIDPMTAAGMVGGLAGLSSGSLSEGIKAGLGAYGGASLTGALSSAGEAAQAAADGVSASGPVGASKIAAASTEPMSVLDKLGAGASAAAEHPMDFIKDNKFALGAIALPALADMATPGAGPTPLKNTGYIRRYAKNPETGALEQVEAVPVDDWGSRSAVSFGGVGQPVKYMAGGGITTDPFTGEVTYVGDGTETETTPATPTATPSGTYRVYNPDTKKYDTVNASGTPVGPVTFGGVARTTPVMRNPNDTRSDSQSAYDYLMGKPGAQNPMLFYHQQAPAASSVLAPLDLETRTGGHYVLNAAKTGYDWIPDTAATPAAADAGIAALAAGRGQANPNNATDGSAGIPDNAGTRAAVVAGNQLGTLGNIALGKIANLFAPEKTQAEIDATDVVDKSFTPLAPGDFGFMGPPAPDGNDNGFMGPPDPSGRDVGPPAPDGRDVGPPAPSPNGDGGDGGDGGGGEARGGLNLHGKYFPPQYAQGGIAALAGGGLGSLGGYSDGGQLLKGPGDGVSDSIPATIGQGQPARLADGEFVIPARIVSELGNGSTEAGAKQLYAMMARIQAGRAKTTGKNKVATDSKADRHLPA